MRKLSLALLTLCLLPQLALAQLSPEDTGLETTGEEVYGSIDDITIGSWVGIYIINPLMSLVGVIFLVLMIYGGFLWMTAGGNSSQVDKAKNILITAVIGTVIISAAYAITNFVFEALS
ncbi:hypothetical protein HON52_00460 [Candidatus Uhrbacteria bacterium]|jgi:hypothetical protein|nr:hypothetical protein [Candidatus Uhrbacteria bacterium]